MIPTVDLAAHTGVDDVESVDDDKEKQSDQGLDSEQSSPASQHAQAEEAKSRLRDILLRNRDYFAQKSQVDVANSTSVLSAPSRLSLQVHFPTLNKERLHEFEKLLHANGRYMIVQPTFKKFLSLNCDKLQVDTKRELLRQFTLPDLMVVTLLATALLLSTPDRGHLNSLAGLIILQDPSFNYSPLRHGELLFISSISTAVGRLVTGFIIDANDPIHTFAAFSLISAFFVVLISQLHAVTPGYDPDSRYTAFLILQAFNVFFQSGINASGVKFLHDHFRPSLYGRALVVYAIGGRVGSIISSLAMGSVVNSPTLQWQAGSVIAFAMCFASVIPVLLIKCFPHPSIHSSAPDELSFLQKHKTHEATAPPAHALNIGFPTCDAKHRKKTRRHLIEAVKRLASWWQRRSFVLMACANAGMAVAVSGEGFEGIASLFTGRVFHTPRGIPTGTVTIFSHLGAILSLIVGGVFVERLNRPSQARVALSMTMISCFAAIGLIGLSVEGQNNVPPEPNMSLAPGARTVYFFIGFGLGYPFSVTVQKFAMNFGGAHAGLVSQTLGFFATAVCAIADGIFGSVATRSFPAVGVILAIFIFSAWLFLFLFDFFEWVAKIRLKNFDLTAHIAKIMHGKDMDFPAQNKRRLLLVAESESFHTDISHLLDKRVDSTHRGLHYLWSAFTFSLALFFISALFLSYYWVRNPSALF